MKILLMCGAGASSGFMAQAMRKAASAQGLDIEIIARSDAEMMSNLNGTDLIMFGPHLAFKEEALKADLAPTGIPYTFIDNAAYGKIDGEATLKKALDFLSANGKVAETVKEETKTATTVANEAPATGFMGWVTNTLSPALDKVTRNVYIYSVQQSIMSILPMIMIGSVSSVVGVLKRFQALSWLPDIGMVNTFSFGLIAIFLAILVPMKVLEKSNNEKLKISAMLTSLALFFIITIPEMGDGTMMFIADKLGTGGMLSAVVVGIFTSWVFNFASKHSLFSKDTLMPDMVVNWVDALIPVTVVLCVGLVIMGAGFDLPLFIRGVFEPIANFGQTLPGLLLITGLTCVLYSFGFTWILFPIAWTIWMTGMDANMAAVAAGQAATNVNLMETVMGITYIGGQGCTLALVIMCMLSKVKRLKTIGRITLFPSIFNINEPIVFGAPVVWNPILMIPLILNSVIIPTVMFFAFKLGLVPVPAAPMQMWYLPTILQGYLATGSIMGVVLVVVLFAISWLIWTPFFKVYEKQAYAEEQAELASRK